MNKYTIKGNLCHFSEPMRFDGIGPIYEFNNDNIYFNNKYNYYDASSDLVKIQIKTETIFLHKFYIIFLSDYIHCNTELFINMVDNYSHFKITKFNSFETDIGHMFDKYMLLIDKEEFNKMNVSIKTIEEYLFVINSFDKIDDITEEVTEELKKYKIPSMTLLNVRNIKLCEKEKVFEIQYDDSSNELFKELLESVYNLPNDLKQKYNIPSPIDCYRLIIGDDLFLLSRFRLNDRKYNVLVIEDDILTMFSYEYKPKIEIADLCRFEHNGVFFQIKNNKVLNSATITNNTIQLDKYAYFHTYQPGYLIEYVTNYNKIKSVAIRAELIIGNENTDNTDINWYK